MTGNTDVTEPSVVVPDFLRGENVEVGDAPAMSVDEAIGDVAAAVSLDEKPLSSPELTRLMQKNEVVVEAPPGMGLNAQNELQRIVVRPATVAPETPVTSSATEPQAQQPATGQNFYNLGMLPPQ